jgi:Cu(I)/Ag(I) efflux system membrane fusion protein
VKLCAQQALARIAVPNPGGQLRPGAQANVLLAAASPTAPTGPLLVTWQAISHDGPRSYVWTQTGPRQYRRVLVQAGAGTVPILTGVRPRDQVIVAGAYLLQSELALRQGATNDHLSGMAM